MTLELSDKDPAIVFPSNEHQAARKRTDAGSLVRRFPRPYCHITDAGSRSQNAGWSCIGIECLIVHSSRCGGIYAAIVERTKQLRLSCAPSQPQNGFVPTVDRSAMIIDNRFDALERALAAAENHGATTNMGGKRWKHPYLGPGAYFRPTAVGTVDPATRSELAQR